jgi:outer membrane protein assembly factor BamB
MLEMKYPHLIRSLLVVAGIVVIGIAYEATAADWPTNRGNAARTGSVDNTPGPKTAKVIWVHKSTDHFVAAPVPAGDSLLVSSLAAFNTSSFQSLAHYPARPQRIKWAKSVPYLKLPTVCAPAVAGNLVVFGDGMHQTDGAILHGVRLDNGLPLWQYPVPGQLVHLEGAPTIANGRVIIGGGNAGVICVDPSRLELDGKEVDSSAAQTILDARWKDLQAKYEQEKKVDPDFAIPPSEDSLPKPKPKLLWQVGAGKWHVDAAVAVTSDHVLVASAFLDAEKTGDRALISLKLQDGSQVWRAPLKHNPWAGPTVAGDVAIVGCSSVRLEPKAASHAQGEVVAVTLTDGSVKWRKEIPAGVVSAIAVSNGLGVFTATDGCVRAWDVATGQERWKTDRGSPYFASPAIAGEVVYVADLKGRIQALNLSNGQQLWSLDLATDPAIQAPGMVYGGPVVSGGRLYVATCNLDTANKLPTAVICIGDK